jgi:monofunctional biosynthetic peptidoglycan transglycosylase
MKRLLRWTGQLVLALVLLVLLLQFWYFAHIVWWTRFDPVSTSFMRAQHDTLRERDPDVALKHRWIDYDQISPHLKRAVIAAEDANFTEHDGVDWDAIERAYESNLKKGKVVRGGSTITMQLAKNLFLSGERSYLRKAQELVITYMLESMMSKRRILEIYLNVAEWGVGVFGCEAAARHHFGTSCAQLAPVQAARLAAMLPRPALLRPQPRVAGTGAACTSIDGRLTPP